MASHCLTNMMTSNQLKEPLSFEDQAKTLLERGLTDVSLIDLEEYLQGVNYYRLNAYFHDELDPSTNLFPIGFSFKTLQARYEIDAWLRKLILLALEPIEIKVRTQLAYWSAHIAGSDMFYDSNNFTNQRRYLEVFDSFNRVRVTSDPKDPVLSHHNKKYSGRFPIWVVVEYLSFGNISKLLAISQSIVSNYVSSNLNGIERPLLISWVHSITVLRNISAHYGFLFNRSFSVKPKKAYWERYQQFSNNNKLFPFLIIIKHMSAPQDWIRFYDELDQKISSSTEFLLSAYGFPVKWKSYLSP